MIAQFPFAPHTSLSCSSLQTFPVEHLQACSHVCMAIPYKQGKGQREYQSLWLLACRCEKCLLASVPPTPNPPSHSDSTTTTVIIIKEEEQCHLFQNSVAARSLPFIKSVDCPLLAPIFLSKKLKWFILAFARGHTSHVGSLRSPTFRWQVLAKHSFRLLLISYWSASSVICISLVILISFPSHSFPKFISSMYNSRTSIPNLTLTEWPSNGLTVNIYTFLY